MRDFVFIATLNIGYLFFAIYAILGKEYQGISESSAYSSTVLIFVLLSMIFVLGERFFKKRVPLNKTNFLFYLLPFIVLIIYVFSLLNDKSNYDKLLFYLAFSFPAIYIGTYVADNKLLKSMSKWWDLVSITMTAGIFLAFAKTLFTLNLNLGGVSYQSISYMAAFAYSLSLTSLLFPNEYTRFRFFRSKFFNILIYPLMLFQVSSIFLSGGRGGFVVVFIITIVLFYLRFKKNFSISKILFRIISIYIVIVLILDFLPEELRNIMENGFARVFSYLSADGIDITKTSRRDVIYSSILDRISEKPILGYGLFHFEDNLHAPHNIILELLLDGGMVYLFFWIIILALFYRKFKWILRQDSNNVLLIPISVLPFVELQFSGSYFTSSLFWFAIVYVFNFKAEKKIFNE
jgi:hypothetical protein